MKLFVATVSVPLRALPPLAATLKLTVPAPLPLAPEVTVMNPALLTAVQLHPVAVVTARLPLPPAAEKFWLVGLMANEQAAPSWVTVWIWEPMMRKPVRA